MADVNITSRYLNQDKREGEAITVSLPAVSNVGGGRTQKSPVYNQFGDLHIAYVIPNNSITQKTYLVIEEAFPAGATISVNTIAGAQLFSGVDATVLGLTVATLEDELFIETDAIRITVDGGTGDILTGLARVVTETIPYLEKNGRYSSFPHANDHTQSR